MSRSGYSDGCYGWDLIRWRGAVKKAIRGKRGQAFLREMLVALDALPEKKLVAGHLATPAGEVCAIGSVLVRRGVDTSEIDVEDWEQVAQKAGISEALVREIEHVNDEAWDYHQIMNDPDEYRFAKVRHWVVSQLQENTDGQN